MTSGRETHSSMPSRRISSMRIARCSSPRPDTFTPSARPRSSTRSATLTRNSRSSLSLIWRSVTARPSSPAKGPVLTRKNMATVGSSISRGGNAGSRRSGDDSVSPMRMSCGPVTQTISPADTSSTSSRSKPRVTHKCVERVFSVEATVQSESPCERSDQVADVLTRSSPLRWAPWSTRPQPIRPR